MDIRNFFRPKGGKCSVQPPLAGNKVSPEPWKANANNGVSKAEGASKTRASNGLCKAEGGSAEKRKDSPNLTKSKSQSPTKKPCVTSVGGASGSPSSPPEPSTTPSGGQLQPSALLANPQAAMRASGKEQVSPSKPSLPLSPIKESAMVKRSEPLEVAAGSGCCNGVGRGDAGHGTEVDGERMDVGLQRDALLTGSPGGSSHSQVEGGEKAGTAATNGDGIAANGRLRAQTPVENSRPATERGAGASSSARAVGMGKGTADGALDKGKGALDKGKGPSGQRPGSSEERENGLWTNVHRPRIRADLVGNKELVQRLHNWLFQWNSRHLKPRGKNRGSGKGGFGGGGRSGSAGGAPWNRAAYDEEKKAALLSGPPGLGKTSMANIICRELGFDVMEVNASDSRSKADRDVKAGVGGRTTNMVKELITNCTVQGGMVGKKTVLVMDEVDGMSGGDRGGVADLIQSIGRSKIPIICICNDKYDQKIKSLVAHCMELDFRKPSKKEVAQRLMKVAEKEGLTTDEATLEYLVECVQGDIRLALNHMQFARAKSSVLRYNDVLEKMRTGSKDVELSPFNIADRLFTCAGLSLSDQLDLAFSDADLVPLLIQENYINYRPLRCSAEQRIEAIVSASALISDGDVVTARVRGEQQWSLMPLGCVASTIAPASIVRGGREPIGFPGERNFNRFSAWLGQNSKATKNRRLLGEMHMHMLVSGCCGADRSAVRLDYMPLLLKKLTTPMRVKAKEEGAEEVVEEMAEYCLTRDDWLAVQDISAFKGKPDPLDGVSPQAKAHFTRLYNAKAEGRTVRSSILLPRAARVKAKKREGEAGEDGAGREDGEGGDVADDRDGGSDGDDPSYIPGVKRKAEGAKERGGKAARGKVNGGRCSQGGRGKGKR